MSWFKTYGRAGAMRLFCFPHAGGAASMFRAWTGLVPETVELTAVQLPGREGRFREPPYDRMAPLIDDLADAIDAELDVPFAFLGCSMGARLAFSLTHELIRRGRGLPKALFVAGSPAPSLAIPVRGWNEPDDVLLRYVVELGATPAALLADPDMLALSLPLIRADLAVVGSWDYPYPEPLPLPVRAFCGSADEHASERLMRPWAVETEVGFQLTVVPGNHFFFAAEPGSLLRTIASDICP